MDAPATLVWLAPQPPDTEQSRALSSWGSAHGLRLTEPRDERPPALTLDPRIPDEVEELLDRARDAVAARDGVAVDSALDAAEARLRAHPELPQSAWLMAEVLRGRSTRWRRVPPMDSEAAERSRLRAEALDGGRVPGVAEREGLSTPPALPATVLLALSSGQQAWLDGAAVAAVTDSAIPTRAGLHALVVTSGGAPIWAAWIEAPPGSSTVRVDAPDVPPCSSIDVSDARLDANAVNAVAAHVRCAAWVVAAPGGGPASVRVARCEAGKCDPLVEWHAPVPSWTWTPPVEHGSAARWPAWATWGLVGAGAAIAAGVTIAVTGVLAPAPAETRYINGGLKTH